MYITPRVLIQQEFTQLPVYSEFPLPSFIIGPNYSLTRYNEATEKPFTAVGTLDGAALETGNQYIPGAVVRYDFPNVPAGGDVDPDYTKVFTEAVEAKYFPLDAVTVPSAGDTDVVYVNAPSGSKYANKLRFSNVILRTANGYSRSAHFSNRDVAVNDIIEITDGTLSVKAKIKALEAETSEEDEDLSSTVASVLFAGNDGATSGTEFSSAGSTFTSSVVGQYILINGVSASNGVFKIVGFVDSNTLVLDRSAGTTSAKAWQIGGVYASTANSIHQVDGAAVTSAGTANTTVTAADNTQDYVGYVSKGVIADTYTVSVTTAGNAASARFSVASAKQVFATKTDLSLEADGGDYLLMVDENNGNDVQIKFSAAGGTPISFAVGNVWSQTVTAASSSYAPAFLSTGGTYHGTVDMVYTLRVERGGPLYDGSNADICARVVVSSSNIDTSRIVLPKLDEAFNLGTFGATATLTDIPTAGGLILGDVYYVRVTAAKLGKVTIVELSEKLPDLFLSTLPDLTASLYLTQKSVQIPQVRDLLTGDTNWDQEDAYISINPGITTYDAKVLDSSLVPARLPIAAARVFVEHRDLLQTNVNSIDSVRSLDDVSTKLGVVHPDNPLAQGVYDAVLNAQNQLVYFIGVATNDLAGYTEAIKISEKSDKVYSFVPLTFDRTIQDAVVSHVNAYSTPEVGRWRVAWLSVEDKKTSFLYDTKEDGTDYLGTITDDTAVSGSQYRLVTIEGAKFIDDGVRPNDSIYVNFRLSPDGKYIYDEYIVDRVRTNSTLLLTKSLTNPIEAATKIQVVRNYTRTERATNIALVGGEYNNRRVRVVFPDTFKYGKITKQGYFAAAGLAGLRSGVVPHQGLTNSEYLGADDLSKVVLEFTQDDLNTMAEQGIWLITQEVIGATPYVRHQLTTDERSLNTSEDSITTNVDNISYALKKTLSPFIGRYNVNIENVAVVRDAIVAELTYRATGTRTARAGNQLTSFTPKDDILLIQQNPTYKDRIDVEVRLNVPYPLNYINLKLIV